MAHQSKTFRRSMSPNLLGSDAADAGIWPLARSGYQPDHMAYFISDVVKRGPFGPEGKSCSPSTYGTRVRSEAIGMSRIRCC